MVETFHSSQLVGIPVSRENAIGVMGGVHRARCAALGGHDYGIYGHGYGVEVVEPSAVSPDDSHRRVTCDRCGHEAVAVTPDLIVSKATLATILWWLAVTEIRSRCIHFRCKIVGHRWEETLAPYVSRCSRCGARNPPKLRYLCG